MQLCAHSKTAGTGHVPSDKCKQGRSLVWFQAGSGGGVVNNVVTLRLHGSPHGVSDNMWCGKTGNAVKESWTIFYQHDLVWPFDQSLMSLLSYAATSKCDKSTLKHFHHVSETFHAIEGCETIFVFASFFWQVFGRSAKTELSMLLSIILIGHYLWSVLFDFSFLSFACSAQVKVSLSQCAPQDYIKLWVNKWKGRWINMTDLHNVHNNQANERICCVV